MKTWIIVAIVLTLVVGIPSLVAMGTYNSLVGLDVDVDNAWYSGVMVQYQRRHDLIPRIVNSTRMYIEYEKQLLLDITEARSRWADALSGSSFDEQAESNTEMDGIMTRFLAVLSVEAYPQLKADQLVADLIYNLEGTENRVAVARMNYNDAVAKYNGVVRTFPTNFIAGMFGFSQKDYWEAGYGTDSPPDVNY